MQCVMINLIIFIICCLDYDILGEPLIISELPSKCLIQSNTGDTTLISYLQVASNGKVTAYFNLCDYIPEKYCGKNVKACITDTRTKRVLMTASEFYKNDTENIITNSQSTFYNKNAKGKLAIHLGCSEDLKNAQIVKISDYDYEIHILDPKCILPCTIWIHGRLKNLKALEGNYFVQGQHSNFSVNICGSNRNCKDGISSCGFRNNTTIAISSHDRQNIEYSDEKGIKIHGSFKQQDKGKPTELEVILKCDWSRASPKIHYLEPLTKGRHYKFEMLTSYGCIKVLPSCEFKIDNMVYNFKPLARGEWKVSLPSQGQLLLNVCGPLIFPNNVTNHCVETYAQACERNGNVFINRGSLQHNFNVIDDMITVTFTSGDSCHEDNSKKYTTRIEFMCGAESGPKYKPTDDKDKCQILLAWVTPIACPKYDKQPKCITPLRRNNNCTFEVDDYFYDLNGLSIKNYGAVKDPNNNSVAYLISICEPAMEDPCKQDVLVVLKYLNELDIRKKEISLGKFKKTYRINNMLVIETTLGAFCEKKAAQYYRSKIYLECAENEEHPELKQQTDCLFEFVWKTKAACPILLKNAKTEQCIFKHPIKELDLRQLKHKSLTIHYMELTYVLNICDEKPNCDNSSSCIYVPVANYRVYNNQSWLEYTLNKTCKSADFNRAIIQLLCDPIINNGHYKIKNTVNCTIVIELWTHLVCSGRDLQLYIEDVKKINVSNNGNNLTNTANDNANNSTDQHISENEVRNLNCTITSPYIAYQLNLADLNLNISFLSCPSYTFNYLNKSLELKYTKQNCQLSSGKLNTTKYVITIKCFKSTEKFSPTVIKKALCYEYYEYKLESSEFCKLMETSSLVSSSQPTSNESRAGTIIGAVIGTLLLLLLTIAGFFCFRKKRKPDTYIHLKNCD